MTAEQKDFIYELYCALFNFLVIYADCSLNNMSLAEEVVQETFRITCTKSDELISSSDPKEWLLTTLKKTIQSKQGSCIC